MARQANFRDAEGWSWVAVEHEPEVGDDARTGVGRVLYFLSRYQTRRTEDFPMDWQLRPASDLLDLWLAAVPV